MALPLIAAGAAAGAGLYGAYRALKTSPTKAELKRRKMEADTLLVVQPKTTLQRTATNIVNSLFF